MVEVAVRDILSAAYFEIGSIRHEAIDSSRDTPNSPNQLFGDVQDPGDVNATVEPATDRENLWAVFVLQTGAMNQTLGSIISALGKVYLHDGHEDSDGYQRWPSESVYPLARSALEISATLSWLFEDCVLEVRVQRLVKYLKWVQHWESVAVSKAPREIVEQFCLIDSRYADLLDDFESTGKFKHTDCINSVFGDEGLWRYNLWSAVGHGGSWPNHYARSFRIADHVYGSLSHDNESHFQVLAFMAQAVSVMLKRRAQYLGYSDQVYSAGLDEVVLNVKPFCKPGAIEYND